MVSLSPKLKICFYYEMDENFVVEYYVSENWLSVLSIFSVEKHMTNSIDGEGGFRV